MGLPAIFTDTRQCAVLACGRFWCQPAQPRVRAVTVNGFHVKDSQIRLPLVESEQRIVIRAEVLRRRLATSGSIEHLAQRHTVYDAAVHAKTHDAPRPLVHHDEHPVRV